MPAGRPAGGSPPNRRDPPALGQFRPGLCRRPSRTPPTADARAGNWSMRDKRRRPYGRRTRTGAAIPGRRPSSAGFAAVAAATVPGAAGWRSAGNLGVRPGRPAGRHERRVADIPVTPMPADAAAGIPTQPVHTQPRPGHGTGTAADFGPSQLAGPRNRKGTWVSSGGRLGGCCLLTGVALLNGNSIVTAVEKPLGAPLVDRPGDH